MLIEKNTNQDKSAILAEAVRSLKLTTDQGCCHDWSPWMQDFDDQYVYLEVYNEGRYKTYRAKYSYTGTAATISPGALEEVVRMTEYKLVEQDTTNTLKAMFSDLLQKHFGSTKCDKMVIKAFDEEKMEAIEPLFICAGDVDAHGDTYTPEEARMMVNNLSKAISDGHVTGNLFHKMDTDKFTIEKVWMNEVECMIGETLVPENQPIVKVKFHCPVAWEKRKTGQLAGLSIGAQAEWENVDD